MTPEPETPLPAIEIDGNPHDALIRRLNAYDAKVGETILRPMTLSDLVALAKALPTNQRAELCRELFPMFSEESESRAARLEEKAASLVSRIHRLRGGVRQLGSGGVTRESWANDILAEDDREAEESIKP